MKILILINGLYESKEKTLQKITANNSFEYTVIENSSGNLLNACDQFISEFEKQQYDKSLVIWVTGVTFTNLLNKKYPNLQIQTVQSISYLEQIKKESLIDILVLGSNVIGQKNIVPIVLKYFL